MHEGVGWHARSAVSEGWVCDRFSICAESLWGHVAPAWAFAAVWNQSGATGPGARDPWRGTLLSLGQAARAGGRTRGRARAGVGVLGQWRERRTASVTISVRPLPAAGRARLPEPRSASWWHKGGMAGGGGSVMLSVRCLRSAVYRPVNPCPVNPRE
jgi:hypothetical protein